MSPCLSAGAVWRVRSLMVALNGQYQIMRCIVRRPRSSAPASAPVRVPATASPPYLSALANCCPALLLPANLTLRTGRHLPSPFVPNSSCVSVSNRIISMLIARHFVVAPSSLPLSLSLLLLLLALIILSFMQSPWPLLIRLFAAWVLLPLLLRFVCILINVFLLVMQRSCLLKGYDCPPPPSHCQAGYTR